VPAEAAGVVFSANPVTNRRHEAIVTASYGLGTSIVGGTVAPDKYIVLKGGSGGPRDGRQLP
jgi:pyruvate,water dikinase